MKNKHVRKVWVGARACVCAVRFVVCGVCRCVCVCVCVCMYVCGYVCVRANVCVLESVSVLECKKKKAEAMQKYDVRTNKRKSYKKIIKNKSIRN